MELDSTTGVDSDWALLKHQKDYMTHHYRLKFDFCFPENLTPTLTHNFLAEVDEKSFFAENKSGQSLSVGERNKLMCDAIGDIAFEFLVASDLTFNGMIGTPTPIRVIASKEAMPKKTPDAAKRGIKLWYYPPQKL